jgi:hypothetical protein
MRAALPTATPVATALPPPTMTPVSSGATLSPLPTATPRVIRPPTPAAD